MTTSWFLELVNPCRTSTILAQPATFDSDADNPLIKTSVLLGTDNGDPATEIILSYDQLSPSYAKQPNVPFAPHHDAASGAYTVDGSEDLCGPKKYVFVDKDTKTATSHTDATVFNHDSFLKVDATPLYGRLQGTATT
jgi:hypothetical protein